MEPIMRDGETSRQTDMPEAAGREIVLGLAAVGFLHGEGIDPVVAPVALARELRDGHQAEGGDAEFGEAVETGDDAGEGAGERDDCCAGCWAKADAETAGAS